MAPMLNNVNPVGRELSQFGDGLPPDANICSRTDLYAPDSNRVSEL